ncbi:MAG: hypothetical protein FJ086_12840 [Deltaproteobacteria bacterium]|nr:hypothetical protein [Deltaproteobacteria bacterium]
MAARRKGPPASPPPSVQAWGELLGEAIGRGMARGFHAGLSQLGLTQPGAPFGPRPRGRPPKAVPLPVPADKRCQVKGCPRPARSKGLCGAHYQAERRRNAR